MMKLFSGVNGIKSFKLQKREKRDEFKKIHLDSLNLIKDQTDNDNCFICLYEIGKVNVDSSFLSDIFYSGINYVNKYKIHNYRSIYNLCYVYEDYAEFEKSIPFLINNHNTNGYLIVLMNEHSMGLLEPFLPIYRKKDDNIILLGQYIYGYLPLSINEYFGEMILNNNYLMDYCKENKNLYYEAIAEFKIKNNGLDGYHNNKSLEELYNIIVDAYVETLNNYHKKQADYALSLLLENRVGLFSSEKSRLLLKKYVVYADLKRILATGLNCNDDMSLDELYEIFTNRYSNYETVKKNIKR